MKIALLNHGCAKNLVDIELMAGILAEKGHKITLDEENADIILINTCSFIRDAETESVRSIVSNIGKNKKIIVTGCLPQKYKRELQSALPEVYAFIGISEINEIADIVDLIEKDEKIFRVNETPVYSYPENAVRQQITVGASSYLKIAEGCNCNCGYCIIPKLRGKYVSRPVESIVHEAKSLAYKGVSEIILIAQDTTYYGKDLYGKRALPQLLKELTKIDNLQRIRIMYTYPTGITNELLSVMKGSDKIFNYIDIPLQHVSKKVLKSMKRPVSDYRKLIEKIRNKIPDIAIRTTFIVGYPGETEEDFQELKDFISDVKFDRIGVFEYSLEKDTYSYTLKNRVNAKTKKARKKELMELQKGISEKINEKLIGQEIECIVEYITDKGAVIGRTYKDAPEVDGLIYLNSKDEVLPGDIVTAKITKADTYDLWGDIV